MRRAVALVALLALASVTWTVAPADDSRPTGDSLGWEGGYRYDDRIAVTPADGLNATERNATAARAMARIEYLRGLEFEERVDVTVISREQYLANRSSSTNETHSLWNNQVWEALFLVGDDADVTEVLNSTLGSSVVGFYRVGTGEVVIVSDSREPALSRGTLVHELVHALQDQHFGLGDSPDTQDAQLARNGVVEGEANRIQRLYQERCEAGWSCVTVPDSASGGGQASRANQTSRASQTSGGSDAAGGEIEVTGDDRTPTRYDRHVFFVVFLPYSAGPGFVDHVARTGGTDALNALYEEFPASSEQILHPRAYPAERPANVTVPDRSDDEWRRFDHDPVADTVGEGSIYATMAVQGVPGGVGGFSYSHPASEGWGGDALVPYRDSDRDRFGYVWETVWDSQADAREFHEAYLTILESHDARSLGDGRYEIPDADPFGGAYRVVRDGATVRIVHGPTPADLRGIHRP